MDTSTCTVLCSLAGIDTGFNMSNLNLLPGDRDTLLAIGPTVPDTDVSHFRETDLRDSPLLPEQLIARKRSLDEFRTEQRSCPEKGSQRFAKQIPVFMVLNSRSVAKPDVSAALYADLKSKNVDICCISET